MTREKSRSIPPTFFRQMINQPIELVLFLCASFSIMILFVMLFFVAREGTLALSQIGGALLSGQRWDVRHDTYGGFPFLYGSVLITSGSLLVSIPLGVCTAIFIAEVLPFSLRDPVKSIIELLASIPSVIYGFLGMVFLAPLIASSFDLVSGKTALTASLVLAVMTLPTVVGVASEIISSVPKEYKEAALGLGATRWQTLKSVVLPLSKSGILASVMLGFGRAIGETIAVLMVAGNVAKVPVPPWNLFAAVYTIPGVIAAQMAEAAVGSLEYSALFGLGLILFIIAFVVNTLADIVVKRTSGTGAG
jgi:phosphate transport system permease protein